MAPGQLDDNNLRQRLAPVPTRFVIPDGKRAAAVVAPFFRRGDTDYLLLLRRRQDLRHHGGELAFPGGRREPDETPVECALREMEEEVGIAPEELTLLGGLAPMTSLGGFHVHAVVARMPTPLHIRVDAAEIELALEVPVPELLDEARWDLRIGDGAHRPSPHFDVHTGDTLWGLTAWFTRQVLEAAGPGVVAC